MDMYLQIKTSGLAVAENNCHIYMTKTVVRTYTILSSRNTAFEKSAENQICQHCNTNCKRMELIREELQMWPDWKPTKFAFLAYCDNRNANRKKTYTQLKLF